MEFAMSTSVANGVSLSPGLVQVGADLAARLQKNFDRLERDDYRPGATYIAPEWPGDFVGRVIYSLAALQRRTGRAARFLDGFVDSLPALTNARGYLGPAEDVIDEQALSGHGWLISGLVEHALLTNDPRHLRTAERMVDGLVLPLRGRVQAYPKSPDQRTFDGHIYGTSTNVSGGWRLSTDIGCAFISLEGLVRVAHATGRADLRELIAEMHAAFESIDLVAVSAQLHASLTAARMFLQHHAACPNPALLATARRVYDLFRRTAITENYANYNWFRRPTWTEPCAIVDALILATELFRQTGEARYLDDAHHIYFNALGFAQKPHGGFGCDSCLGAEATFLYPIMFDVVGCCNMRGSLALTHLVDYAYLAGPDALMVPFFFDSTARIPFADGQIDVRQQTTYPTGGQVQLTIQSTTAPSAKTIRLFVPPWTAGRFTLSLNGEPVPSGGAAAGSVMQATFADSFVGLTRRWQAGDRLELQLPMELRTTPLMNPNSLAGLHTYRHGPLVLGVHDGQGMRERQGLHLVGPGRYRAAGPNPIDLYPLNDAYRLAEDAARNDRKKVLFR
jgi:DUF1680 family protein